MYLSIFEKKCPINAFFAVGVTVCEPATIKPDAPVKHIIGKLVRMAAPAAAYEPNYLEFEVNEPSRF